MDFLVCTGCGMWDVRHETVRHKTIRHKTLEVRPVRRCIELALH